MSVPSVPHPVEARVSTTWFERASARCKAFLSLGALSSEKDDTSEADPVMLAEVERALSDKWFAGTFTAAVEDWFLRATRDIRNRLFVRILLMGMLLYNLFLPVDVFVIPDVLRLALFVHLGVGTPLGLIALAWVKLRRGDSRSAMIAGVLFVFAATTLVLFLASRSPHADLIGCTFGLMTFSANTGVILRFRQALVVTSSIDVAAGIAILLHPSLDTGSKLFCLLLTFGLSVYAVLGGYRIEAQLRRASLLALRESLRARLLASTNRQLQDLVDVDALTGVGNRRYFDAALLRLWQSGVPTLALIMADIDHFKRLNDRFGHQAGDACLRAVAALIDRERGPGTTFARYGGEEFALLIEGAGITEAVRVAERLRLAVAAFRPSIDAEADALDLSISLGCACGQPGSAAASDLVAAADAALYLAKRKGRNRTEAATARPAHDPYAPEARLPAPRPSAA